MRKDVTCKTYQVSVINGVAERIVNKECTKWVLQIHFFTCQLAQNKLKKNTKIHIHKIKSIQRIMVSENTVSM